MLNLSKTLKTKNTPKKYTLTRTLYLASSYFLVTLSYPYTRLTSAGNRLTVKTKVRNLIGALPIIIILALIGYIAALGPSFIFNPPYVPFILQAIFVLATSIGVAIISSKGYLNSGSHNLILIGVALTINGITTTLSVIPLGWSANIIVTIANLGTLVSAIIIFLSGVITSAGKAENTYKRKKILAVFYTVAALLIISLLGLGLSNWLPTFLAPTGPTPLRLAILGTIIFLFFTSASLFFWRYLKAKYPILYWYSLALVLYGVALTAALFTIHLGDAMNWTSRAAIYLSGVYFLLALLSTKVNTNLDTKNSVTVSQKWAESLRSDRHKVDMLFANMSNAFAYCKMQFGFEGKALDYVFLDTNEAFDKLNGLEKSITGEKASKLAIDMGKPLGEELEMFGRVASTGEPARYEAHLQKMGKWIDTFVYCPQKGYFALLITDISERKKAEEKILQSQKTFYELVERAPFGIYIIDSQIRIAHMNIGSQNGAFKNVRPIIGRPLNEAMHILWPAQVAEEIVAHFRHTLETGEPYYSPRFTNPRDDVGIVESYEWELQRIALPDGQFGVICYYFDSTKLKNTERHLFNAQIELKEHAKNLERLIEERTKQLRNSERLAAIGATAGMVGHDIRNPLHAMSGDVFLAKSDIANLPDSEEKKSLKESLDSIEENIFYINKIVGDLQDYARPLRPHIHETDIKAIIENVLSNHGIPGNVEATFKVEEGAQILRADSDYLKRIVSNLALNAVQAMPKGGKLTIHAFNDKETGDNIISVTDNGTGIPEDVREKLFTPMFTTKSKGQGFGLAVVKRLAESLGGSVSFESQIDVGTTFTVRLPQKALSEKPTSGSF